VENLNLHYGENHALKDVNMEIADHAITAFIGPSGCGLGCWNTMPTFLRSNVVSTRLS